MAARIQHFLIFSWLFGAVSVQRLCLFVESDCCCHFCLLLVSPDAFASTVARALLCAAQKKKKLWKIYQVLSRFHQIYIYFPNEKLVKFLKTKNKKKKIIVFAVLRILYRKVSRYEFKVVQIIFDYIFFFENRIFAERGIVPHKFRNPFQIFVNVFKGR